MEVLILVGSVLSSGGDVLALVDLFDVGLVGPVDEKPMIMLSVRGSSMGNALALEHDVVTAALTRSQALELSWLLARASEYDGTPYY